jgi:hypothetical protein
LKRRPRQPFVDLCPAELTSAVAPALAAGLFLGRFDQGGLRRELRDAGMLDILAARGYPDVVIRTDVVDNEHRLRVRASRGRVDLVDLRVSEVSTVVKEPALRATGLEVLSFLAMTWLAVQHPAGRWSPERPRLPGQRYPSLGLGRRIYLRLLSWAEQWGKDGLLTFPAYFHNAVFYARAFRFLSPARQGRLLALQRDLATLHVAAASAAVEDGRVVENGRPYAWEAGEMVAPLTPLLRAALQSDDYRRAMEAACDSARYAVGEPG